MQKGYSMSNRQQGSGGLPLWLVALAVVVLAVVILAAVVVVSSWPSVRESAALPTLIATAAAPTETSGAMVPPTLSAPPATNTPATFETATVPPTWTPAAQTATATSQPLPTNTSRPLPTATTAPIRAATASPTPDGWLAQYFNNRTLSGDPAQVRYEPAVAFDWGPGSPSAGIVADGFSVRWQRTLPFAAGPYRFNAASDDGVRVWLDNQLIIDQWRDATGVTYSADRYLTAGNHSLRVEYYENWGTASVSLWWVSRRPVPPVAGRVLQQPHPDRHARHSAQ